MNDTNKQIQAAAQGRQMTAAQQQEHTNKAVMSQVLKKSEPALKACVLASKTISYERFMQSVYLYFKQNPKILQADPQSVLLGIATAAQDGLELGKNGAWLIPFKGKATYILSQYATVLKVMQSGVLDSPPVSNIVYENDIFSFDLGLDAKILHKRDFKDRGAPVGVYAACKTKDGQVYLEMMGEKDLKDFRKKYSLGASKQAGPWFDPVEFWEMGRKTVIKKLMKNFPIPSDMFIDERPATIDDLREPKEVSQILDELPQETSETKEAPKELKKEPAKEQPKEEKAFSLSREDRGFYESELANAGFSPQELDKKTDQEIDQMMQELSQSGIDDDIPA